MNAILNIMEKLKTTFMNYSIRHKMLAIFMAFMLFYIGISAIIYIQIINNETMSQVKQRSHETTELIKTNIATMISNANNVSKILTTNSLVRSYLHTASPSLGTTKSVNELLTNIHITSPSIDSIYIYDLHGSSLRTTKYLTTSTVEDARLAPWFEDLKTLHGGYKISINADNTLKTTSGKNLISVMRVLNDLDSLTPIGVLILNISEDSISDVIKETTKSGSSSFILLDKNNNPVVKNDPIYHTYLNYFSDINGTEAIKVVDNQNSYIYKLGLEETGWTIISSSSLSYTSSEIKTLNVVYVVFIVVTLLLFILASLFTASLITSPIKKLIKSMQGVANGVFKRVSYNTGTDEIGELKNNYNLMIMQINDLIIRLVDEEKQKRRFELDVLNEQIKPHFLYNTLDNIAYLALAVNNQKLYEAVNALGSFCRISLSKGSEKISLGDEITLIKNYLSLQKLRYGDMINDEYHIDQNTLNIKILKNVLQPLVENCIYHGIRPSGEPGLITTSAHLEGDHLYISVEDNGMGMEESEINSISDENLARNQSSFGLRGTIQRLKIHYGSNDIYKVESEKYAGTKIILKIPIQGDSL
ncbi:MAG: putative signal transduction protein with a C-terminal ATPase domain [Eubacterium sp.]|jgi:two-component system sensor histidine kinase YesM|nr:putative signal transduction protein with a C-terminal ATPase domain [Eubacterium sp.]